jgi:hypothetical protein
LSGENKPKVIEVILKFAKLYDGTDFNDEKQLLSYFDSYIKLDFMRYKEREQITQETFKALVDAIN